MSFIVAKEKLDNISDMYNVAKHGMSVAEDVGNTSMLNDFKELLKNVECMIVDIIYLLLIDCITQKIKEEMKKIIDKST